MANKEENLKDIFEFDDILFAKLIFHLQSHQLFTKEGVYDV